MVSTNVALPTIIGDIYESACEPGHQGLTRAIMRAIPGNSGVTVVADPCRGPASGDVVDLPQSVMESYSTTYWKIDPWAAKAGWSWSRSQIFRGTDVVTPVQLMETRYYDEFAKPISLVRLLTGMMSLGPAISAAVVVHRSLRDPDFTGREYETLEALLPHIRRSLQLHRRLNGGLGSGMGLEVLDALAFGAVVCDARGRVTFANRAAEELAHAGAGVILGGRDVGLRAAAPEDTRQLMAAVARAAGGGCGGAVAVKARDGQALHVLVAPLPRRFVEGPGLALVAFRPAADQSTLTETDMIRLFDLTPAEARLAVGLVRGRSMAELAEAFGVSLNTLKTQLGQVTQKTGADCQRDLVRRLSLVPPLRQAEMH